MKKPWQHCCLEQALYCLHCPHHQTLIYTCCKAGRLGATLLQWCFLMLQSYSYTKVHLEVSKSCRLCLVWIYSLRRAPQCREHVSIDCCFEYSLVYRLGHLKAEAAQLWASFVRLLVVRRRQAIPLTNFTHCVCSSQFRRAQPTNSSAWLKF